MSLDDQRIAEKLWSDTKAAALGTADLTGHSVDEKKLTQHEAVLLWNQEADGWSHDKELALLASGKSRQAVGLLKYPNRQKLMEASGRYLDKYAQYRYADSLAKLSDPTYQTPPGTGEPPLPMAADPTPPTDAPAPAPLPLGG